MIVARNFGKNSKQFRRVKESSHVSVEMCRGDPYRDSMFDLCPDFAFRFFGLDMGRGCWGVRPKIARRIEQTRNLVFGLHRTPPVCFPFPCDRMWLAEADVPIVLP